VTPGRTNIKLDEKADLAVERGTSNQTESISLLPGKFEKEDKRMSSTSKRILQYSSTQLHMCCNANGDLKKKMLHHGVTLN
jgi:hypothetical protein